jgi:dihydroorotase-like cyclic amidohydrolase
MAQIDLTVKNGTIVTPTCSVQVGIAIKAGKIVAIASSALQTRIKCAKLWELLVFR